MLCGWNTLHSIRGWGIICKTQNALTKIYMVLATRHNFQLDMWENMAPLHKYGIILYPSYKWPVVPHRNHWRAVRGLKVSLILSIIYNKKTINACGELVSAQQGNFQNNAFVNVSFVVFLGVTDHFYILLQNFHYLSSKFNILVIIFLKKVTFWAYIHWEKDKTVEAKLSFQNT